MTDKYKDLRDALAAEPTGDKWACAHYSPKTLGVGINGGPALFMVREGSYTDIHDAREIVRNLLTVRREARALLAERDALREALDLVDDLSSQEWQDQNGKRMAATGNDGKRFWFITDDVMRVVRAALTQEQGDKE